MANAPSTPGRAELTKRVVSALVLAPAVLAIIWVGGWPYSGLVAAATVIVSVEWQTIVRGSRRRADWVCHAAVLAIVAMAIFGFGRAALIICIVIAAFSAGFAMKRHALAWRLGGLAYAAIFGVSFLLVRGVTASGLALTLSLCAIVWATDIAAYFVGRRFGGPKLWPAVSPKKTWSGAIGGLIAGVAVGSLSAMYFGGRSMLTIAVLSALLSVTSQFGDLFESFVKRRHGVKDSGTIIPGHGGLMDRLDGLGAAAILAAIMGVVLAGSGFADSEALRW